VPIPNPAWNPWRGTAAAALHGLGRDAQALALAEEEVALLRRWGAPTYLGTALRRLGQLRGGSAGLPLLREAVEVLAPTHAALELARARFALGATAELPDAEAVPLLRAASEAAADLGAEALLRRACSALTARGRPDGHRPTVRRASRTEREVLDLAAGGATVREIAQRLFLTPGTVQAVLESGAEPAAVGADGPGLKLFSSAPPEASGHPSRGVR
jgi:DNA-binding CsgD family transcriptional regulator